MTAPDWGQETSHVPGSYVLSSCLFDIPVDRTRDAGPGGARHILQMSGRSPGVLSREEAGEELGISSLECARKNSSSWGLSVLESLSD